MSEVPLYKRKNTRKRTVDRSAAHFAPYFDFGEPEPEEATAAEEKPDPVKLIMEACQAWIDRGNQIERYGFGVSSRGLHRTSDEQGNITVHSTAFYRATGEKCCPLGAILMDTPSSFMPLLDAAKVLQVDHFWIIGFVHATDLQSIVTIGRNLEELQKHDSYNRGKQAGYTVSARFIKEPVAA